MRLIDAVAQLTEFADEDVIFLQRPWSETAMAKIGPLNEDLSIPAGMVSAGYDYFLEVAVANEALGVFGERQPTRNEQCRLLVHYAENDAYPDWAFKP